MATNTNKIYTATVTAPTNIACIKYWGKANIDLNTPINDSVSVTLDQTDLRAVTTVAASTSFTEDCLYLNGRQVPIVQGTSQYKRFYACLEGVRALATDRLIANSDDVEDGAETVEVKAEEWANMKVHVSSYNTFPTAAGLASSAAGYAALTFAFAVLFGAKETYEGELTTIARQGSGSACRSLYGGFVAWEVGDDVNDDVLNQTSKAVQVAPETHWPEIRALILVVSDAKKDTSSTAGMSTSVATSRLLAHRAEKVVPERMKSIEAAFMAKDFDAFGKLTMQDSNQFHATCLDTYPPIFYMNDVSRHVIRMIHIYNDFYGCIRAAYTFDAGPNAVLYTLEEYQVELLVFMLKCFPPLDSSTLSEYVVSNEELLNAAQNYELSSDLMELVQQGKSGDVKMFYCTKSGPGPQILGEEESLIDIATGENKYFR